MADWLEKIVQQWDVVKTAPVPFITVFVGVAVIAWWAVNYAYETRLANKNEELASKDGQIALLIRQRDDYKEKLGGASPDEAKGRIDKLEAQIAALSPRRLTDEQKARLTSLLRQHAGNVEIANDMAVSDARALAGDLVICFSNAGWKIITPAVFGPSNPPPHGIGVIVPAPTALTPNQTLIVDSLHAASIQFDLQRGDISSPMEAMDARILISAKSL